MPQIFNTELTVEQTYLFNMLFRHQVYLEGVKSSFAKNYKAVLTSIYESLRKYLYEHQYTTMDQFNRAQLRDYVYKLNREQIQFYSYYTKDLLDFLKAFIAVDSSMFMTMFKAGTGRTISEASRQLKIAKTNEEYDMLPPILQDQYQSAGSGGGFILKADYQQPKQPTTIGKVVSSADQAKLWAAIKDEPIPANGFLLPDYINAYTFQAANAVLLLINRGYANNWTIAETIKQIVGDANTYRGGLFARLYTQNAAMVDTIIQHANSMIEAGLASVYFDHYMWSAMLENSCVLCTERNGTIYVYGKGPLPPAHYRCACKPVPVPNDEGFTVPKSYYSWIKNQPTEFQNDVLGESKAIRLRSGDLTAGDFVSIYTPKPLTLEQFQQKIKFILGD